MCGILYLNRAGTITAPLKAIKVSGKVVDRFATADLSQTFKNNLKEPVESTFEFPLEMGVAVTGFTILKDGHEIKGVMKKKADAMATYDDAMSAGQGAYMMEQKGPETFKVSVGNLDAGAEATIRISFVRELSTEGSATRFVLPTAFFEKYTLMQQQEEKLEEAAGSTTDDSTPISTSAVTPSSTAPTITTAPVTVMPPFAMSFPPSAMTGPMTAAKLRAMSSPVTVADYTFNMRMEFVMSSKIVRVTCPQKHTADITSDATAVVVELDQKTKLDRDIVIAVEVEEPHKPAATVTRNTKGKQAVVVSFVPEEPEDLPGGKELIFLVDCSGSMQGDRISEAKKALNIFLRAIPEDTLFNIVCFGSKFTKMFKGSLAYNNDTLDQATAYVAKIDADMGGTEIYTPLSDIFSFAISKPREVFVLTDGQVRDTEKLIDLIKKQDKQQTRVFTFGIGDGVDRVLVQGMARVGLGAAEFVVEGERLDVKVMRQLKRAMLPAFTDVKISYDTLPAGALLAPEKLTTIFGGDQLVQYVLLESTASAPTKATLSYKHAGKEHSVEVPIVVSDRGDNVVHALAAKAALQDLANGNAADKEKRSVTLSLEYGVLSDYTNYVAVDEISDPVTQAARLVETPTAVGRRTAVSSRVSQPKGYVLSARRSAPAPVVGGIMLQSLPVSSSAAFFGGGMSAHQPSLKKKEVQRMSSSTLSSSMVMAESMDSFSTAPESEQSDRRRGDRPGQYISPALRAMPLQQELQSVMKPKSRAPSGAAPPPPPPPSAAPVDVLSALIGLQRADGSWKFDSKLVALLHLDAEKLKQAHGDSVSDVFATTLAIVYLEEKLSADRDVWSLSVAKAVKYLKKGGVTEEALEKAKEACKQLLGL